MVLDILDTDVTSASRGKAPATPNFDTFEAKVTARFRTELEILWAGWEATDPSSFISSETVVQRELLPASTRGGIDEELAVAYFEYITRFSRPSTSGELADRPSTVSARYRVAQFLGLPDVAPPRDANRVARSLERQAGNRAVAIIDYDLTMQRVQDESGR